MSLIGACVYYFDPTVEHKLTLLQPHFVVVGSGAWTDVDAIAGACAPTQPLIIMRDMSENLIDQKPVEAMRRLIVSAQSRFYTRVAAHLLNEAYSDVMRARAWELEAIGYCKSQNFPTVALNLAYGNDPDPRFRDVADATTYIGQHLYDGWDEAKQEWVDRIYTSRRYASNWLNNYRHKIISTEVGIEAFPATGQRRGWADMGIPEETVRLRMLANALHWKADGLLGVAWFTAGHTEASWNEGYGMTEGMAKLWGTKGPQPNQDGAQPPIDNGGEGMAISKQDLETARLKVREEFLNVQRALEAGKINKSYTEQGAEIDGVFGIAGKGANVTDAEFAALAKKLTAPPL